MSPLTLCLLQKYPPIEGGVSQQGYWLAHNLARAGHRVHVVTNAAEVEPRFRIFVPRAEQARLEGEYPSGGFVRVHWTEEPPETSSYIPYANPFVSKLSALATEVVREHGCQLLWSSYLEPYGVAAMLVSALTGVPYAIRHAGSDIVSLAQIPRRRSLYLEVFRRASLVSTSHFLASVFRREGVAPETIYPTPRAAFASEGFSPEGPRLEVHAVMKEARARGLPCDLPRFDPSLPTVGLYGKASPFKGMEELILALGQLRRDGQRFNFLAMVGLHGEWVQRLRRVVDEQQLGDRSSFLPFLPHWMVPQFIRRCTTVCYLENGFPIEIHTPQIGWEIMACGTPVVISSEVLGKSRLDESLRDGQEVIAVDDPTQVEQLVRGLTRVLDEPEQAAAVGRRGAHVAAARFPAPDVELLTERIRSILRGDESMALRELQRTLADLYTDEALRRRLLSHGEEALKGRDLDEGERATLCELGRRLASPLQELGVMLLHKRTEYFLEMFPTVGMLLGPKLQAVREAFGADYDFRYRSPAEDAEYFHQWLRQRHQVGAGTVFGHPALADALTFDHAMWRGENELALTEDGLAELPRMRLHTPASVPALEHHTPLMLGPGVQLLSLEYPVHTLLHQGADPASLSARTTHLGFSPRAGVTPARAHRLSAELLRMVRSCAQPRRFGALLEEVAQRHPERRGPALEASLGRALSELVTQGVLQLHAPE